MKNVGTILLSAGVLFVGFALLTPLLFFLIGLLLDKRVDGNILLQMEYALLSFMGIVLLSLGSVFSVKLSLPIIVSSVVASLSMVVSIYANKSRNTFDWIVTGCYYISLLVALGAGIAILHTKKPQP